MIEGLVSTVIPVFERPGPLQEAVASVLAQTYRPIEIVIVDDGSTDETSEIAAALASEHAGLVRWHRQANGGPGVAREAGRQLARGEFVQYLDSDDLLYPAKFESQVNALKRERTAILAFGASRERRSDGSLRTPAVRPSDQRVERIFPAFLRIRHWNTPAPLYRAASCEEVGPWTDLRLEEDWEYDCRLGTLCRPVAFVSAVVAECRAVDVAGLSGRAPNPASLRDRARAHELILGHAWKAGVPHGAVEMARFSRELFLLARQCGAMGLAAESRRLFGLARDAAGPARAAGLDFRVYRALAAVIGWTLAGRLAAASDRWRSRAGKPPGGA